MPQDSASSFSYRERLLIAPREPGPTMQFLHARLESTMSLTYPSTRAVTPFPRSHVRQILDHHNATQVLIQVGTSSSRAFGHEPLNEVGTWPSEGGRLDLGPSGVLVRATIGVSENTETFWGALLHELVAQRILLAPLFSLSLRRLQRHWISWTDDERSDYRHFQLILPVEGSASLSSEGMHAFAISFSPCHNESGIFAWNSPKVLSEFFLKRQSITRHSWWILMERTTSTTTRITKGIQIQPHISPQENGAVSLKELFPASTRHRLCPFVGETTLDTLDSPHVPLTLRNSEETSTADSYVASQPLTSNHWKEPWMKILPVQFQEERSPHWEVHQTLRRPRGPAYAGTFVVQVIVRPDPSGCPVSVDLQWFLPPITYPTWQSFKIVQEDRQERVERLLDWRHDLQGTITAIDRRTGRSSHNMAFDEGTIHFHIPHWNVSGTHQQTLTISLDYRPAFLSFENFPGDANRGVEVPSATAIFVQNCGSMKIPTQLYSNSLLLMPPVPDMSMPFNVLSMTCSLYAFIIGSVLNLLIRKSSERVQRTYDPSKVPPNKLRLYAAKAKEKVMALIGKKRQDTESDSAEGKHQAEPKETCTSSEAEEVDPTEIKES